MVIRRQVIAREVVTDFAEGAVIVETGTSPKSKLHELSTLAT